MKTLYGHRSKESGAVLEILMIGVVIIGAMALIAWRYIETDKAQNEADRALSGLSHAVISEHFARLVIPEFGISVRYDDSHGPLTYSIADIGDSSHQAISLVNEKLAPSSPQCSQYASSYKEIGAISVYNNKQENSLLPDRYTQKDGKYFYLVPNKLTITSDNPCADQALLKKRSTIFPSIFVDTKSTSS